MSSTCNGVTSHFANEASLIIELNQYNSTGSPQGNNLPSTSCEPVSNFNLGNSASVPVTLQEMYNTSHSILDLFSQIKQSSNNFFHPIKINSNTNNNVAPGKANNEAASFVYTPVEIASTFPQEVKRMFEGRFQSEWVKPVITDKTGALDQEPPYIYTAIGIACTLPQEIKKLMASLKISENEAIVTLFCRDWAARKGFEVVKLPT